VAGPGDHHAVARYRPQAAPPYPTTVAKTNSWITSQMVPFAVVPVPRNEGMNHKKVVPNRKIAPAASVLNRAIASSFHLMVFDSSLRHGSGGSIGTKTWY
jgi:hypothetical protein